MILYFQRISVYALSVLENKEMYGYQIVKEIEKRDLVVYTPDFPTGVGYQNYENWSKLLKVYFDMGLINENTTYAKIKKYHFL